MPQQAPKTHQCPVPGHSSIRLVVKFVWQREHALIAGVRPAVADCLLLSFLLLMLGNALWIHLQPHPLLGLATLNHPQLGVPWNCMSRCIRHTAAMVLLCRKISGWGSLESFGEVLWPSWLHVRANLCLPSPDLEQTSACLCT